MPYFLTVDIGGTVIKSGLYDGHGREKAVASQTDLAIVKHVGWSERDMTAMWRTVCATVREVVATAGIAAREVAGVSFSAHGKGLYLVDGDGAPVRNGIISSDNRALPTVRRWKAEGVDAKAYPRGYQQLWTGHPVSLLAWLKEREPESYRRVGHVLMAHDWVRYKFTGAFGAEVTNISGSNLYNVGKGAYDPELFKLFGIDEMLGCMPPVLGSEQSLGGVSRAAAAETGLIEGTPVYGGFFDVVSAAVCAGLSDARFINVIMGTWTIVTWTTDHMETTRPHPYIWGRYCIPGRFFVHEGSPTSAGNLEWFVHTFMADAPNPYDRCNAMVEALGKAETNIQFLPYLFSSNLGDNLSACFYGFANAHGLNHIVQAIYEGVCFSQHVHLERIRALSGPGRTLRLTGGPTRSKVWMQMVADISEQALEVMDVRESGCLGGAIAAAVGSGVYASFAEAMAAMCPVGATVEPDLRAAPRYRAKYAAYRQLAEALDKLPVQP
jgi:L-xylulokinase